MKHIISSIGASILATAMIFTPVISHAEGFSSDESNAGGGAPVVAAPVAQESNSGAEAAPAANENNAGGTGQDAPAVPPGTDESNAGGTGQVPPTIPGGTDESNAGTGTDTVVPPGNGGGSGGGGGFIGNGPVGGFAGGNGAAAPNGLDLGPSCVEITSFFRADLANNGTELSKLQSFLKDIEGFDVDITGVYDEKTVAAVKAFQAKYASEILAPWGATEPSGFAYITTMKKVNELRCRVSKNFTAEEIAIIRAYRDAVANGTLPTTSNQNNGSDGKGTTTASSTPDNQIGQSESQGAVANVFSAIGGGIMNFFRGIVNLFK